MQRLCKLLGGEALEQDRRFVFAFNSPQTLLQLLTDAPDQAHGQRIPNYWQIRIEPLSLYLKPEVVNRGGELAIADDSLPFVRVPRRRYS